MVRVKPRLCDWSHRKNNAFALSATMPTKMTKTKMNKNAANNKTVNIIVVQCSCILILLSANSVGRKLLGGLHNVCCRTCLEESALKLPVIQFFCGFCLILVH